MLSVTRQFDLAIEILRFAQNDILAEGIFAGCYIS